MGLEVEWRRTDPETLVHLYQDGESQPGAQQQDYLDRAHFFTDQIQHGNFALRLDNLRAKDQGQYTCKVYSQQDYGETEFQIKVVEHFQVSGLSRPISATMGDDVTLHCSVDSHIITEHIKMVSWKKTDEDDILVLLYQDNKALPDLSNEQYRDRVEFFTDEIPKGNFSLRLKNVGTRDKGVYMCQVFAGNLSANATAELEGLDTLKDLPESREFRPMLTENIREPGAEGVARTGLVKSGQKSSKQDVRVVQRVSVAVLVSNDENWLGGGSVDETKEDRWDGLTVHGPSGPLVVPLGSTVVLPCYIDEPLLIMGLEVEWRRTGSETLVHLYQDGESRPEAQQQDYLDRAHFFTDQIQHGNFALRLDNLRAEDEGQYTCKVYSQQYYGETKIQIKVVERLLVSGLSRSISATVGDDVTLNCSVDSHITTEHIKIVSWRKTDEDDILVLLYQDNAALPALSNEQYRDRVEFFTDEIPKGNFSLKLKNVRTRDKGVYMCQVFAGSLSASATAELERLGLSVSQTMVLILCISASGSALLLCCLIYCKSTTKAE
ncbi:butyrophilin-like protein 2 [Megalobrama amblycephala]|uniref:butyrophilin-like protein 2 n=1 Tax=Megalobrama amblycephala TaxID=75352 RepID=UPI002014282C|nr:butyrophilin-like protein 2 [Megalobrama amblycephala]